MGRYNPVDAEIDLRTARELGMGEMRKVGILVAALTGTAGVIGVTTGPIVPFIGDLLFPKGQADTQIQSSPGTISIGNSNQLRDITIYNYPKAEDNRHIKDNPSDQRLYADGQLSVDPLECLHDDEKIRCNLVVTSISKENSLILQRATLQSSSRIPYLSSEIGFAGGRFNDKIVFDQLHAGVPTVIFAEFRISSKDEQEGTLFFPVSYERKNDVIKLAIETR